jgi:hypothetical protein
MPQADRDKFSKIASKAQKLKRSTMSSVDHAKFCKTMAAATVRGWVTRRRNAAKKKK